MQEKGEEAYILSRKGTATVKKLFSQSESESVTTKIPVPKCPKISSDSSEENKLTLN